MKDQKAVRIVLCLVCMWLSVCLTGCSVSFCGIRPGGRGELIFSCREELLDPEEGAEPEAVQAAKPEVVQAAEPEALQAAESKEDGISDGRVNINTAGMEELMTLSGIGETRARTIVEYRTQNGPFTKAEDIMQIPGIKEGIYSKIQDQIIVQ